MTARRSLEDRIARFFAGTLAILYGFVAVGVWGSSREHGRKFAMLTLETEVESATSYIAASGRFDAPELRQAELEPFPIWMRVTQGDHVLAETPGSPDPPRRPPAGTEEFRYWRPAPGADSMLVLRHAVGGPAAGPGGELTVVAIGDITSVRAIERRLGFGLVVLAALVIPLATWLGRLVARRALAPMTDLVTEIRALSDSAETRRLAVHSDAVAEVSLLAESFNDVLARLDANLASTRRFTEDTSHEIRNPLAVLRTGLEVMLRRERSTAEYRAQIAVSLEEIVRLQSILDGLLLLARSEPERRKLMQRERVDLAALAREMAARFSVVASERRSPIDLKSGEGACLEGDPRLLRLVLFNLLDNALKHGTEGRPVHLDVKREGDELVIAVVSSGAPIPEARRALLFERYDRPGTDAQLGVGGLGLSVVQWAAQAHGGAARYFAGTDENRFEVVIRSAPPV